MRHINDLIFLGAGKHTFKQLRLLRRRLKDAIEFESGLQQGALYHLSEKEQKVEEEKLKDCLKDITRAFGYEARLEPKPYRAGK